METALERRVRDYTRQIGGTCFLCGEKIDAWRRSYAHVVSRDADQDQVIRKTHLRCAEEHSDEWSPTRCEGDLWRENELTLEAHIANADRLRREWEEKAAGRPF
jgi:hypothetical protein